MSPGTRYAKAEKLPPGKYEVALIKTFVGKLGVRKFYEIISPPEHKGKKIVDRVPGTQRFIERG